MQRHRRPRGVGRKRPDRRTHEACVTPDQERWAEALKVEEIHGDSALIYVADRIGALALEGDLEGVERWQQIAARLDRLYRPRTFLPV